MKINKILLATWEFLKELSPIQYKQSSIKEGENAIRLGFPILSTFVELNKNAIIVFLPFMSAGLGAFSDTHKIKENWNQPFHKAKIAYLDTENLEDPYSRKAFSAILAFMKATSPIQYGESINPAHNSVKVIRLGIPLLSTYVEIGVQSFAINLPFISLAAVLNINLDSLKRSFKPPYRAAKDVTDPEIQPFPIDHYPPPEEYKTEEKSETFRGAAPPTAFYNANSGQSNTDVQQQREVIFYKIISPYNKTLTDSQIERLKEYAKSRSTSNLEDGLSMDELTEEFKSVKTQIDQMFIAEDNRSFGL